MSLSSTDRSAITETISMHGHLVDAGELDRLGEVFTEGVIYDLSALGGGRLDGLAALRDAAVAMGDRNPVGHHVTNVVISETGDEDHAEALSKGIGIKADGSCGSVVYEDLLARTAAGWRIERRKVIPRRKPLRR